MGETMAKQLKGGTESPKKISSYARRMRELTDSVSRRNRKIHGAVRNDGSGDVVRHDRAK
jgi:hypothetical protein